MISAWFHEHRRRATGGTSDTTKHREWNYRQPLGTRSTQTHQCTTDICQSTACLPLVTNIHWSSTGYKPTLLVAWHGPTVHTSAVLPMNTAISSIHSTNQLSKICRYVPHPTPPHPTRLPCTEAYEASSCSNMNDRTHTDTCKQTDRQTDTYKQTDRQTDRHIQADRQTHTKADRQTDRHIQADRQTDTDRQTHRHIQADRQTDRHRQTDTQTHTSRQTDRHIQADRQTDRQTNRQTVSRQWSQCSVSRLLVSRSTNDIINIHSWIFTIISTVIHNLTKTTVVRNSKPRPVSHCRVLPPGNPTGCLKKVAPLLKLLRIFSLQLILSAWNFTNLLATHIHIYLCKHPGHHTAGAATWWPCITLQGAANWRPHGPLQGAATWQI